MRKSRRLSGSLSSPPHAFSCTLFVVRASRRLASRTKMPLSVVECAVMQECGASTDAVDLASFCRPGELASGTLPQPPSQSATVEDGATTSKRARAPSELGQPKVAKSGSAIATTMVAATVVLARPATIVRAMPAAPEGSAGSQAAAPSPASTALIVPAAPFVPFVLSTAASTGPVPASVSGAPTVAPPQGQAGAATAGTSGTPVLASTQRAPAGAPMVPMQVQAGMSAMSMVAGQPWGVWPVMVQAGPGGYPGMVMQWMPTAAMATQDGGLPVHVVCRGCGLVRFDVEGRRWVHNHRQGKGNKQFVCDRVLCGCMKGQICPNKGQPHDPVAPGVANPVGVLDQGASSQAPVLPFPPVWEARPLQPGTSSLPPILSIVGTEPFQSSLPPILNNSTGTAAASNAASSSSSSQQPSNGQAQVVQVAPLAVSAPLVVTEVPSGAPVPVPPVPVVEVTTEAQAPPVIPGEPGERIIDQRATLTA